MSLVESSKIEKLFNAFVKDFRHSILKVDDNIYFFSFNAAVIGEKIEKINKSLERKSERGLVERELRPLDNDIRKVSRLSMIEILDDMVGNLEKYKGRVFLNGNPLYKKYTDQYGEEYEGLNSDFKNLFRYINHFKGKGFLYPFELFSSLNVNVSDVGILDSKWDVLGVIKQEEGTFTIYPLKGDELSEKYFSLTHEESCSCDHCGVSRDRVKTFILRNKDDGDEKIIGGSCLKDFVNEKDLDELLKIHEAFMIMGDGGQKIENAYDKRDYLATVNAFVRTLGVYRGSNTEYPDYSTNSLAKFRLSPSVADVEESKIIEQMRLSKKSRQEIEEAIRLFRGSYQSIDIIDEDYDLADEFIVYLAGLDISKVNSENGRVFLHNVKNIILSNQSYVSDKGANMLGGAMYGYKNKKKVDAERVRREELKKELEKSRIDMGHFLATEKTKFKSIPLRLEKFYINSFQPSFGVEVTSYMMGFSTIDGRYCAASCSTLDKLPEEFFDERGMLMSENEILAKYRGKYIGLKGSVSDYSRLGNDGEMRMYSKFRINEFLGKFSDVPLFETELDGKYTLLELKFNKKIKATSFFGSAEIPNYYQYQFSDKDGNNYVFSSARDDYSFDEGAIYRVGVHDSGRVYDDHHIIFEINNEFKRKVDSFSVDDEIGGLFTQKQMAKKFIGTNKPKKVLTK